MVSAMPELPEVETMVRGIRNHVEGRRIRQLIECRCSCRPITLEPGIVEINGRVQGQQITQVSRRAKRVMLELESGDAFVIEPRMTGLMLLDEPPSQNHLRLEWQFLDSGEFSSVWFWDRRGLGTVRLLTPEERASVLGPDRLGPDALEIDEAEWRAVCAGTSTAIKIALLDQKRVAGIGNLYSSEILHRSRIAPETPARELTVQQIRRMASAVRNVLLDAIAHEGSTLSDGTYRNALNKAGGYQNAHRVYDREGESCPSCQRSEIVRIVQAQRSTFFCPRCQKRSGTR